MTSSTSVANVRREIAQLNAVLTGLGPLPLQVEKERFGV